MSANRQAAIKLIYDPESRRQVEVADKIKPSLDDTFKNVNGTADLHTERML